MIESLRFSWGNSAPVASAGPNPLLYDGGEYGVDLDRKIVRVSSSNSPARNLTLDDALSNSAFWRAIQILASVVARTPFEIKDVDKAENGVKKTASKDHPAYWATTHQANPEETASECRYRVTANAVMHGAGYAAIRRKAPDGKVWLYPFDSPGTRKERIDGKLWYLFDLFPENIGEMPVWARYRKFPAEDVIEVSGLKKRGLLAYCTWWMAKNALAEGSEGTKLRAARAINGGRPAVVLSTDQKVPDQTAKKIQEDFARIHSGFEGTGLPALMDHGLKATTLPYAAEMNAEETLAKIPTREIANFTKVPSVFLGDPDGISYESLEKMIEFLMRFGVEDYWHSWEDQVRSKLLSPEERQSGERTAEFDRSAMIYMDGQTMSGLIRAWGGGAAIATVNNIRAKLNWEPLDDPEADKLQMPKNIGDDGSNNTPKDGGKKDPGRPRAEFDPVRVMANAWDDTVRRILKAGERVSSNGKAFMHFCDTLDGDAELRLLVLDRSRGAGAAVGVEIDETTAAIGLTVCKNRLLTLAGESRPADLHASYHAAYGSMMVTLPEMAAKAVLEAVNV